MPLPGPLIPAALLGCTLLAGCVTVDSAADRRRAGDLVGTRAAVLPDWKSDAASDPAATWDGQSPLGLRQALVIALANNPELRGELESISAARADLAQSQLLPNPVLSVALRFPVDAGSNMIGASITQDFAALWLRGRRIRAADAELNAAVLSVSDRALRLVADVKIAYAQLVYGERALVLVDQDLAMLERSTDAIRRRVESGQGSALDVNLVRQQTLVLQADRIERERLLARARRELLDKLGLAGASARWTLDESAAADLLPATSALTADEAAIARLALSQRLDVQAAARTAEAAAVTLSQERRTRLLRDLEIGADFERDMAGDKGIGPMVSAPIPIFDFNQAQVAKAGSAARLAVLRHRAAAQRALTQARLAYVDARAAEQLVRTYRDDVVGLAQANLQLAEQSLRAGQADITLLINAQRALIEARLKVNEYESAAQIARIELEYACGGRLPATATATSQPTVQGR